MELQLLKTVLLERNRRDVNKLIGKPGAIEMACDDSAPQANPLYGLWQSPRGVLYACDGTEFVCVLVTSSEHVGWIGKVAVRVTRFRGGTGRALQSFRYPRSGRLTNWEPIEIELAGETLTKRFPLWIPRGELLNGYVERYVRVRPPPPMDPGRLNCGRAQSPDGRRLR